MGHPILLAGQWRSGKRRTLSAHLNPGLEMVLVSGGRTRWQIMGKVEQVSPGSVFFTFPWESHGGVDDVEPGLVLDFAVVALDRVYPRPARRWGFHEVMGIGAADRRWIVHTLAGSPRRSAPASVALGQWIRRIAQSWGSAAPGHDAQMTGLATAAVVELARCVDAAAAPGAPASSAAQRVDALLAELADHCHERWTLQRMADYCRLARTRFAQVLKQQTGDTPTMALNRVRIQRAVAALRDTHAPITRIALDCGFCSSQYFARVFREYRGESARDWRRRHQVRRE